jgi:hypothetical protein
VSLSLLNKIFLLSLLGLPANVVLFSQPSFVEGYQTTPCAECDSPIVTKQGDPIPERCERAGCFKFDAFPMACLAVSIRRGGFKTDHHKNMLSLVVDETRSLRHILTADFYDFWIPRRAVDRKRFNVERMKRSRRNRTLRSPVWRGEERPDGSSVECRSNFPPKSFAKYLMDTLGYPAGAASSLFARAHAPWALQTDRRKNICSTPDANKPSAHVSISHPEHPYRLASPSRRTLTGGGLTEERVRKGLQKMRTDDHTKGALLEIVYMRRSTSEVAVEYNRPKTMLYQYATRLRHHLGVVA